MACAGINVLPYNLKDVEGKFLLQKWLPSVGLVLYLTSFKNLCISKKYGFS